MKCITDIITLGAIAEKAEGNCFKELVEQVEYMLGQGQDVYSILWQEESFWMGEHYWDDVNDRPMTEAIHQKDTKNNVAGSWKLSLLPRKYKTAKSVVLKCLERGGNFRDVDGNVLGKSALEKANREASTTIIGQYDMARATATKLIEQASGLTEASRRFLVNEVSVALL